MKRLDQIILISTFLAFSWLAMQAVHELGHVAAAWFTKADVTKVVLYPTAISQTVLGHNPQPLVVVWAGPVLGVVLPLLALLTAKICRAPSVYLFRFFAGFCLIANGTYIAFGPAEGGADTGVMIQYGSPRWMMVAFGILTAPLGLYLWHRQGKFFGLGDDGLQVDRRTAIVSATLLAMIVGVELIFKSR